MPIAVRPEDIKLLKRRLKKDILYRLGLKEGNKSVLRKVHPKDGFKSHRR